MRLVVVLAISFLSFLSIVAHAKVAAFFPQDQATLIIQGGDSDATKLYNAMNVTPSSDGRVPILVGFQKARTRLCR